MTADSSASPGQSSSIRVLIGAAAIVVVVAGIKGGGSVIGPVMLAAALTIVAHPLRVRLETRAPRWLASLVTLVVVYLALLLLALALVVAVGRLARLLPDYEPQIRDATEAVGQWLADRGVGEEQVRAAVDALDIGQVVDSATSVLTGAAGILGDLVLVLTLTLFMVFDSAILPSLAAEAREKRPLVIDALAGFTTRTRSYLAGAAGFGLIVAVLDGLALWALGVPGAFIWAMLAFVTNFIPNVGFVIGMIPPAFIALLEGGPLLMLVVIVVYVVLNFVVQSVIQPRVLGDSVGLSATVTFASVVFWSWVLGPLGALLAVPMTLLVKAVFLDTNPSNMWLDPFISGRAAGPEKSGGSS